MKAMRIIWAILDLGFGLAGLLMAYFFYRHGSDLTNTAAAITTYLGVSSIISAIKLLRGT